MYFRKIRFIPLLMIPLLGSLPAAAQDVVPKAKVTTVMVPDTYWENVNDNNSYIMENNLFRDNWFVGLQLGSMMSWNSNSKNNSFFGNQNPALGVQVGKWLAPFMGIRLQAIYGHNSSKLLDPELTYHWQTWGFSYDLVLNLSNMILKYKEDRLLNVIGIVGVGMNHASRYDQEDSRITTPKPNFFTARIGAGVSFRLNDKLDLNLELTNNWLNSNFDGLSVNNRYDGHLDIMVGITYRIKNHNGTRIFTYAKYDSRRYEILQQEAADLEAQVESTQEIGEVTETSLTHTYVTFEPGKSEITQKQIANVYAAASSYKKLTDASIYIIPNTLKKEPADLELYVERANVIKQMLMDQYLVPAGAVFVESNPDITKNLDLKNSVFIYVNE